MGLDTAGLAGANRVKHAGGRRVEACLLVSQMRRKAFARSRRRVGRVKLRVDVFDPHGHAAFTCEPTKDATKDSTDPSAVRTANNASAEACVVVKKKNIAAGEEFASATKTDDDERYEFELHDAHACCKVPLGHVCVIRSGDH